MASIYRFINADHTLVMRDGGHVISWDAKTNQPTATQIKQYDDDGRDVDPTVVDEIKLWQDSGRPVPMPATTVSRLSGEIPPDVSNDPLGLVPLAAFGPQPQSRQLSQVRTQIENNYKSIKDLDVSASDLDSIKKELHAIVELLGILIEQKGFG